MTIASSGRGLRPVSCWTAASLEFKAVPSHIGPMASSQTSSLARRRGPGWRRIRSSVSQKNELSRVPNMRVAYYLTLLIAVFSLSPALLQAQTAVPGISEPARPSINSSRAGTSCTRHFIRARTIAGMSCNRGPRQPREKPPFSGRSRPARI